MQWKENTSKSKVSPYWVLWYPWEQSPQEERGAWKNCWEMWFDQVGLEGCKGYHQYIGMGKKGAPGDGDRWWSKVSISLGCHMVEFTGISPGCLGFWIPNWARPFQLLTREMLPRHLDCQCPFQSRLKGHWPRDPSLSSFCFGIHIFPLGLPSH